MCPLNLAAVKKSQHLLQKNPLIWLPLCIGQIGTHNYFGVIYFYNFPLAVY